MASVDEVIAYLSQGRPGGIDGVTYMLRTCSQKMTSYNGFRWPERGPAEAPDWSPKPVCRYGLFGLLMGDGNPAHLDKDGRWLVVAVWADDVVKLDGKAKAPRAWVCLVGDRSAATSEMVRLGAKRCVYSTNTGGDRSTNTGGEGSTNTGGEGSTNTGGDRSTNTGGDRSTNTGGDRSTNTGGEGSTNTGGEGSMNTGGHYSTNTGGHYSTNTGGDRSTNTGGHYSTNTGGDRSTNTGGHYSTNTGGDRSTNTGGEGSMNTGGHYSTNTGGDRSMNTGGHYSTNTGGDRSTNTGGEGSTCAGGIGSRLLIDWLDGQRMRFAVAYVGEDGIEPNVPYRVDNAGKWVRA